MATSFNDYKKINPQWAAIADRMAWEDEQNRKAKKSEGPKSKRGSGDQSWLSSIISELGGAGGAAGGAAAGAALGSVVPGLGTIAGGILGGVAGGFLGGTGGRLVENQVRDNEYRLGDALKEGAWSGAFGGIGPAYQGVRGAYAAGKAAGVGGKGLMTTLKTGSNLIDDAVAQAAKQGGKSAAAKTGMTIMKSGAKTGKFIGQNFDDLASLTLDDLSYAGRKGAQSAGTRLRGSNRGVVAGNAGLSPDDVVRQNRALDDVNKWFSGVGKSKQFENADDAMKALTNTYKASGEGAKAFGKNADDVVTKFLTNIDQNPTLRGTLSKKYQQVVSNLTDDVAKIKTNGDFVEFMSKKVNPLYRELKNGNPGSVQTQIYEAFRRAGKEVIDSNMTTRSGINKQFANLMGATESLGRTITRDAAGSASGASPLGQVISNAMSTGMDTGGRVLQQTGRLSQYTTPVVTGAAARGLLLDSGTDQTQPQMMQQADTLANTLSQDLASMQPQPIGGSMMNMPQQQNNPFSPQNAQSAVAQILAQGGDFKDVKDYLAIVETMSALGGTGGDGDLTAIQRNKIAGYNTANQVVDSLEQLWQGVNQPNNQALASATGLPGVKQIRSSVDPSVRQYTQFAEGTLAPIIKSLGETGVLTDRDIIRAYGLVPNLQDSPEVANTKIAQLRQLLSNAEMATRGGNYGTETDIQSALSQYAPY